MNDKADWKERPELGCAAGENGFEKKTDIDRVSGRNGSAVKETGFERQAERSGMARQGGSAAKTAVITGGTRGSEERAFGLSQKRDTASPSFTAAVRRRRKN